MLVTTLDSSIYSFMIVSSHEHVTMFSDKTQRKSDIVFFFLFIKEFL